MSKDLFSGLPDELQELMGDVEKTSSMIEIKIEKRKYGKMWCVLSGFDLDTSGLKDLLKVIKNKLACGGTVKNGNIEVLFGRTDKTKEIMKILETEGFSKDSIHVSGK